MGQGRGRKLVTEEPKPVGSGEIIYSSFYYKYNFCAFTSPSPPCTGSLVSAFPNNLFMAALPIPPLHLHLALIGPQFPISLNILEQIYQVASTTVRSILEEEEPRRGSCLSEKDGEKDVPRIQEESWERSRNRPEPTGFGSSVTNFFSLPCPFWKTVSQGPTLAGSR